jgi:hypothetical protein
MVLLYISLVVLVLVILALIQKSRRTTVQKRTKELRRQFERGVDHKVRLTKGQRFDCPRCASTVPCKGCAR